MQLSQHFETYAAVPAVNWSSAYGEIAESHAANPRSLVGMTMGAQRSVAHALGIKHIQQVSEWERGDVRPGRKHLAKLAEVLGLEIADLLPRIQPDLGANQ
jgi:transcriptional regulator with XRE-family HTH domain